MKKLVRMVAALLIVTPMFFSCSSLNGDLEDVVGPQSEIIMQENGTENGGDDVPDEPGNGK